MKMVNKLAYTALFLALTACSGGGDKATQQHDASSAQAKTTQLEGNVLIDGSSTVFPISEAVAEEFQAVQPRVRVSVGVSGTGGGFKKFMHDETDINDASRPVKAKEMALGKETGTDYIELPIAYDGISVVVNKNNDFVDELTVAELKKIWEPESKVKLWSEVREGWPAEEIKLYGPGADSGTFDYFTKAINGKEGASRADYSASEDDNVIVNGVAGDKHSLGFFGFAYYEASQDKLKIVPINNGKATVQPTLETINDGSYAPLSRPIFIYVNPKSLDKPQVAAFVNFYLDNAATLAEEVGYIKLPEATYSKAKKRLKAKETGTAYAEGDAATVDKLL